MSGRAIIKFQVGIDPIPSEIVEEKFSEIILSNQQRIKAFSSELIDSHDGISGRSAPGHFAFLHINGLHQFQLALFIDQRHDAFLDIVSHKEVVIHFCNNIYNGISNAVYIVLFH